MSEGTAREIVAKAAWEAYTGYVTRIPWDQANYFKRSGHERIADAVLAALREAGALAPAELTAEQREACGSGADAIRGQVWASEGRQGNPNPDDPQLGANRMLMDHWRVLRRLAVDAAPGEGVASG